MIRSAGFILTAIILTVLFSCQTNRYKNGLKTGLWIYKDDNGPIVYKSRGRFKNGNEKGTWKHFHGGTLFKTEKFSGNGSQIRFYHPNKKISASGNTQLDFNGAQLHWYYTGDWKYFDLSGNLFKVVVYKQGAPVAQYLNKAGITENNK